MPARRREPRERLRELAARVREVAAEPDVGDAPASIVIRRRRGAGVSSVRRCGACGCASAGASSAPRRASASLRARRPMLPGSSSTSRRAPAAPRRSRRAARGNRTRRESADARAAATGRVPGALLEARLQRPDLLDRRLEAARDRDALGLRVAAPCPSPRTAPACGRSPRCLGRVPRARAPRATAASRTGTPGDTPLSARTRSSVPASAASMKRCARAAARGSRRAAAAGRATARARAGSCSVSTAWPDSSSFCISSNRRAGGTFGHQRREPRIGSCGLRSIASAELRGKPHGAQHAHRILAVARDRRRRSASAVRARMSATPPT